MPVEAGDRVFGSDPPLLLFSPFFLPKAAGFLFSTDRILQAVKGQQR